MRMKIHHTNRSYSLTNKPIMVTNCTYRLWFSGRFNKSHQLIRWPTEKNKLYKNVYSS